MCTHAYCDPSVTQERLCCIAILAGGGYHCNTQDEQKRVCRNCEIDPLIYSVALQKNSIQEDAFFGRITESMCSQDQTCTINQCVCHYMQL